MVFWLIFNITPSLYKCVFLRTTYDCVCCFCMKYIGKWVSTIWFMNFCCWFSLWNKRKTLNVATMWIMVLLHFRVGLDLYVIWNGHYENWRAPTHNASFWKWQPSTWLNKPASTCLPWGVDSLFGHLNDARKWLWNKTPYVREFYKKKNKYIHTNSSLEIELMYLY